MKDQLSALMDGEFEIESSEHILTSVKAGGELKEAWQHYHLIGDAMRGNCTMRHDFSTRVMQALEAEPTVLAPNKHAVAGDASVKKQMLKTPYFKSVPYFKNVKVWSIAASVAAVMFVGLMLLQQQFSSTEDMSPVEIAQNLPTEYLQAHQSAAPSSAAYYIQTASFSPEPQK